MNRNPTASFELIPSSLSILLALMTYRTMNTALPKKDSVTKLETNENEVMQTDRPKRVSDRSDSLRALCDRFQTYKCFDIDLSKFIELIGCMQPVPPALTLSEKEWALRPSNKNTTLKKVHCNVIWSCK